MLTSPVAGSISLSFAIPISLIADTVLRGQAPSHVQIFAAIPITASFIGAAFLNSEVMLDTRSASNGNLEEGRSLMTQTGDDDDGGDNDSGNGDADDDDNDGDHF